jgi:membrane protein required for colicin V production
MDGFTLIDGAVALVIVLSAILAYARGFVREVLAILGWVAAAVVAFMLRAGGRAAGARDPLSGRHSWATVRIDDHRRLRRGLCVVLVVPRCSRRSFPAGAQFGAGRDRPGLGFLLRRAARAPAGGGGASGLRARGAATGNVEMVDNSRSAPSSIASGTIIDAAVPRGRAGLDRRRYEELVACVCAPRPAAAPRPPTRPARLMHLDSAPAPGRA